MVIVGMFLTLLFGFSLVSLVAPRLKSWSVFGISYLVGLGMQTLIMFFMTLLEIKLNFLNVFLVTAILTIVLLIIAGRKKISEFLAQFMDDSRNYFHIFRKKFNLYEKISVLFTLTIFLYVLIAGFYWPVVGWDSIALYDFRAKVFAITGSMDDAIKRGYFFGYPLMTSMAHTWVYLSGFHYPKFIYSLMYVFFSIVFYQFLRFDLSRRIAFWFTMLVMLSYSIFSNAAFDYTNLPYTIYFFLSSVFLFFWFRYQDEKYVILSALFMGLATWIRSTDPFWVVNILLILLFSMYTRKIKPSIIYIMVFVPIQQSWSLYLSYMSPNVSTQVLAGGVFEVLSRGIDFGRVMEVGYFVFQTIGDQIIPYIVLLLLSIYISRKTISTNYFFYVLICMNFAVLLSGAYVFSFLYPGWNLISESLGRMVFVFIPILVYGTAIGFRDINKMFKR